MAVILCVVGRKIGPDLVQAVVAGKRCEDEIHVVPSPMACDEGVSEILIRYAGSLHFHEDFATVMSWVENRELYVDWLLNLWGEQVISEAVLLEVGDSVNVHPSYLPFGRGSDPVLWSQLRGWPFGATLHRMDRCVDRGPIWAQRQCSIDYLTPGGQAYAQILESCVGLFRDAWPGIRDGLLLPVEQGSPALPTQRRSQLWAERTKTLNSLSEMTAREISVWAAAFDYGPSFRALISLSDDSLLEVVPGPA